LSRFLFQALASRAPYTLSLRRSSDLAACAPGRPGFLRSAPRSVLPRPAVRRFRKPTRRGRFPLACSRRCRTEKCRNARRLGLARSEEHTSELQSRENLVCRLLLEKKK